MWTRGRSLRLLKSSSKRLNTATLRSVLVDGYHHDGTNHFEIHVLNDTGVLADENRCDLSRREYQLTLKDYVI